MARSRIWPSAALASLAVTLWNPAAGVALAQSKADEDALRMLASDWERNWNAHDMKALASLFTADADFVNVGARHWKGRKQIEEQHAARLGQFLESIWTTRFVTVQFIRTDVAIVHVDWELKGDRDPDGKPRNPRGGVFTWTILRQGHG